MSTRKQSGLRIRTGRLSLGMTLEDVFQQISGLSVSRLSNWEHGRNMISVEEAKKLALVLNISAAYILTIEDALWDKTELSLLEYFRSADIRGQKSILSAARDESAASMVITDSPGSGPEFKKWGTSIKPQLISSSARDELRILTPRD